MDLEISGTVFHWRGPAPHHFIRVPADASEEIAQVAAHVTYGWGMVPVTVHLGSTSWTTSLWPKDGGYLVPLKAAARAAECIELDDEITLRLVVAL